MGVCVCVYVCDREIKSKKTPCLIFKGCTTSTIICAKDTQFLKQEKNLLERARDETYLGKLRGAWLVSCVSPGQEKS